jgi:hypothetical protein
MWPRDDEGKYIMLKEIVDPAKYTLVEKEAWERLTSLIVHKVQMSHEVLGETVMKYLRKYVGKRQATSR